MLDSLIAFVSAPASARPLAFFRIGIAAVLLIQAYWLAGNLLELYGKEGIVQRELTEQFTSPGIPRLSWAEDYLQEFYVTGDDDGTREAACADDAVRIVFLLYVSSLAFLLLGWRTRLAGFLAWLTHLTMNSTGYAIVYGVDQFANIGLFYTIWMPMGDYLSLDRYFGRTTGAPSAAARLALRVLQIHLCLVYFDAGYEKAFTRYFRDGLKHGAFVNAEWWNQEGRYKPEAEDDEPTTSQTAGDKDQEAASSNPMINEDWFNGEAIWVSIMQAEIGPFDYSWLAWVPWVPMLMCWGTLILEMGYPIFVWPRVTRKIWVLGIIGMHLGIGLTLWLWSFAMMLIVFNSAAFLVSPEPQLTPTTTTPTTKPGILPPPASPKN
jgi:hypothetical protein